MKEVDVTTPTGRLLTALVQGFVTVEEFMPASDGKMTCVLVPGPNWLAAYAYQPPEPEPEPEPELGGEG